MKAVVGPDGKVSFEVEVIANMKSLSRSLESKKFLTIINVANAAVSIQNMCADSIKMKMIG